MADLNPLLKLSACRDMLALLREVCQRNAKLMCEMPSQVNSEAARACKRRISLMAAYWQTVSTYARQLARALKEARP